MRTEFDNEILEEYDSFVISEEFEKEQIRKNIREKLLNNKEELNSENYQILGLLDYESNDWKKYSNRIIENFTKSIEKDKTNFLAQLYLGHIYQDIGKLEKALEVYLKVDSKALKKFQLWRYVKLLEQIGYCTYKLGNESSGIVFFEKVLKWYKQTPKNEHLARPTELLNCLPDNHKIVKEIKLIEDYL
ncbi:hypothetical protein G3I01_15855 [Gramella sp. MT6]|uniref:tetratricopeptide repeat protein n=1 Tax=Gramella sp. MT6 TaxID=2705471 RepID=UPI001C5DB569|nr:tetratricopeptide repeat protein [Gramella sp. MT6]QYA26908.1 hypothetical protein G3I01_15855 [Gramella sp. MT6]